MLDEANTTQFKNFPHNTDFDDKPSPVLALTEKLDARTPKKHNALEIVMRRVKAIMSIVELLRMCQEYLCSSLRSR